MKDMRTGEVKVTEQEIELSAFDKIIKGQTKGLKVLHEDDKCIAFEDGNPIAKVHFIVLAKSDVGMGKIDQQDQALIGHMMVIASKVAKTQNLEKGYRIVFQTGKDSFQTIPNLYLHVIGGQQLKWPPLNDKPPIVDLVTGKVIHQGQTQESAEEEKKT